MIAIFQEYCARGCGKCNVKELCDKEIKANDYPEWLADMIEAISKEIDEEQV